MAVAGLQKALELDQSILRESRSSAAQHGTRDQRSPSPSLVLKMWKEFEDECISSRAQERVGGSFQHESTNRESSRVLGSHWPQVQDDGNSGDLVGSHENGTISNNPGESPRSLLEHEDAHSTTSEHSQGFGDAERAGVRQILREWMNTGGNVASSNCTDMSSSPRTQLLCQSELERVRIVREWIQMASQKRDTSGVNGEEQQWPDLVVQIERVREGLVLDNSLIQTENSGRHIRKLCGRQALLDLLEMSNQERQRELEALSKRGLVSCFAYRNRIQSLLRIRLLHNGRSTENSRSNSIAESELGFLRQRQTVSGLREGFFLKLDHNSCVANDLSNGSSINKGNGPRQDEARTNSAVVLADKYTAAGRSSDSGDNFLSSTEDISLQELRIHRKSSQEPDTSDVPRTSASVDDDYENRGEVISEVSSATCEEEQQETHQVLYAVTDHNNAVRGIHDVFCHAIDDVDAAELANTDSATTKSDEDAHVILRESSSTEIGLEENRETLLHDNGREEHSVDQVPHLIALDDHQHETSNLSASTAQGDVRDGQVGVDEDDQSRTDGARVLQPSIQWPEASVDELSGNILATDGGEESHLDVPFLHESGCQGHTQESWLPVTSTFRINSARSTDVDHFLDDDSAHGLELRELLSRRRVSSLLHSGFRYSLDQLIQSYVERQRHYTPDDWEMNEILHPPFSNRDQGLVMETRDHDDDVNSSDLIDESPEVIQSIPMSPLPAWEDEFLGSHWSRDRQSRCPGVGMEMIDDLRIEMARIHQRLNDMHRMLETCMDMQLVLQRSVRHEVSAALNRTVLSSEAAEEVVVKAGPKWDCISRGICCICSESNINSLLYRCGHMCTCTTCAELLMEDKGKCPMCQAPIGKVIRAYITIQ